MTAAPDLKAAVCFLTPLGRSGAVPPPPSPATMTWFPVVGASMGFLLGNAWRSASAHLSPLAASVLTVGADWAVTGALHLDGLADTADGLLAHAPARTRLEIMAEPQVGSFAAAAIALAMLARASALASLEPSPGLLASVYCSSRSVMVVASRVLPYARGAGLATAFLPTDRNGDPALIAGVTGAAAAVCLARLSTGRQGARGILAGWVASAGVLALARRRVGGFTGDILGAAGVVCETASLLCASAKSRRSQRARK